MIKDKKNFKDKVKDHLKKYGDLYVVAGMGLGGMGYLYNKSKTQQATNNYENGHYDGPVIKNGEFMTYKDGKPITESIDPLTIALVAWVVGSLLLIKGINKQTTFYAEFIKRLTNKKDKTDYVNFIKKSNLSKEEKAEFLELLKQLEPLIKRANEMGIPEIKRIIDFDKDLIIVLGRLTALTKQAVK